MANTKSTGKKLKRKQVRGAVRRQKNQGASTHEFPIVGIGASAGGFEAIKNLLLTLRSDTGMAFVFVQHLDPTHESALTSLLSRSTTMAVEEAREDVKLEPNTLYVIPPNKLMVIAKRRLKLSPRKDSKETYTGIDHFLKSLADNEGSLSIGVILSGNGSDGTQGLQAIKAAGGITFAQNEKTAKYTGMPASAVAAGCVDFVLPPDMIARELARIAGHPYVRPSTREPSEHAVAEEAPFDEILTILRQRMGVDFTQYKAATLKRRIQRRLVLRKVESLTEYVNHLQGHADEVGELFSDLLIHVTSFFRNPAVFRILDKKVFSRLTRKRSPEEPIRIWVPGCSTGEEIYSIAMALTEFLHDHKLHVPVQMFGTDINEPALEKARTGIYPEGIQADVTADRLRRFFMKTEHGYRINKSIREMCIIARQNVVTDPPFSNLDLVSCRNVLIYLGLSLQRRVMPIFHYALKPDGFLLLGSAETIGGFNDLFALADNKARLYIKKATHTRTAVSFGHAPPAVDHPPEPTVVAGAVNIGPTLSEIHNQVDRIVLTQHSPAGVIINQQMEVLQFRGKTGPYLEHTHGEASLNLLKMAREGVIIGLRAAVARAVKQNSPVREEGIHVKQNGGMMETALDVVPFTVPPSRERFFLVLFEPMRAPAEIKEATGKRRGRGAESPVETEMLRAELAATRDSLQAIIEEQEATNEELRSANEEIMSSNEEMQSTNEELETAKEELQSTNEELTTLNDELESRNIELEQVNNDLANLLGSVNIPIIIVGTDLRIRRFTAVAEKLLNLIPTDVGRPLTDINFNLDLPDIDKAVMSVIEGLQNRELEAQDRNKRWWSVRIRPYKTTDHKIDGAVIAIVDIDQLRTGIPRENKRTTDRR